MPFNHQMTRLLFFILTLFAGAELSAQSSSGRDGLYLENVGQWSDEVLYRYGGSGSVVDVTGEGLNIYLESEKGAHALQWRVRQGGALSPIGRGDRADGPKTGLLTGRGYQPIRSYRMLDAGEILPCVDLHLLVQESTPKYELHLAPGADPNAIVIDYLGARDIVREESGYLRVETTVGMVMEDPPVAWQVGPHGREPVAVEFTVDEDRGVRFLTGPYDRTRPLVIDPALRFSTYLGGNSDDVGRAVVTAADGSIFVVGSSLSFDYPTTPGAFDRSRDSIGGSRDLFVSKFDQTGGRLLWSTWISASGSDDPIGGVKIAPDGNLLIAGVTTSRDYPVTPGVLQDSLTGKVDGFVTKLDSSGRQLIWSTYYGGEENDSVVAFDIDTQGRIVLGGFSRSTDLAFPAGSVQGSNAGGADLFLARLTSDGTSLVNGTWLGDVGDDITTDIVVGRGGETYLTGVTRSDLFPTTPDALSSTRSGGIDGVVLQLSFDLSRLDWSTYIGGTRDDRPEGIAIDTGRFVLITGKTASADFPDDVVGVDSGSWFVTSFRISDRAVEFSTTLSEDTVSGGVDAMFDRSGRPILTGTTSNGLFPTSANARRIGPRGGVDVALVRLSSNGRSIERAAVIGGSLDDRPARGTAQVGDNELLITGLTRSTDFPLGRFPYDPLRNVEVVSSATDAFLLGWQIDELPNLVGPILVSVDTLLCETSIRDTFYVYNDGEGSFTIFANQLRSSTGPFRLIEPADVTSLLVVPGDSVRYIIEYSDQGVGSGENEVLIFSTDSIGGRSPYVVPITGARVAPSIAASSTVVEYGPVPTCALDTITVQLRNNGRGAVNVRAPIFIPGTGAFRVAENVTFPLRIPQDEAREVPIIFDPMVTGTISDIARFTIQECRFSEIEVRLEGTGSSINVEGLPDSVDLGEIPACASGVDTVLTFVNSGPSRLRLTEVVGSRPEVVILSPTGANNVDPGDTVRAVLRLIPTDIGETVGSVSFRFMPCDSIITLPVRVARKEAGVPIPRVQQVDFGLLESCAPGSEFHDVPLVIDNPTSSLVDLEDPLLAIPFEIVGLGLPDQIEPNGRVSYRLRFRPSVEGVSRDTFRLVFRSGSCVDTIRVPLRGEYRHPRLEPVEDSIDLGLLGPCAIESVTTISYRNASSQPLTLRSLDLPADVELDQPGLPLSLDPGDTARLQLRVVPLRSGPFEFRVALLVGPCNDTVVIRLAGEAEGVVTAVDSRAIDFPPTLGCTPIVLQHDTVRLFWTGSSNDPVTVRSVRLRGDGTAGFTIENLAALTGSIVPEGGDLPIALSFGSSEYVDHIDTIEIVVDPCGDTILIPLTGSTRFPTFSVSGAAFGQVNVGDAPQQSLVIGNESGVPLEFSVRALPPPPYQADTNGLNLPRIVLPGEVLVIPVTFAPMTTGQFTDSLLLTLSEGCSYLRNIRLDGEGINPVLEAELCVRGTYLEPGRTGDTAIVEIQSDRTLQLPAPVDLSLTLRFDPTRVDVVDILGGTLEEVDITRGEARFTIFGLQRIPEDLPAVSLRLLAGEDLFTLVGLDSATVIGGSSFRPLLCDTSAVVSISMNCLVSGVSLGAFPSRILPPAPNPVGERLHLTFQQLEDAETRITIFDASGREVLRPVDTRLRGGRYTIEVDLSELSAGVYLVGLEAGSWFGTERFIKE